MTDKALLAIVLAAVSSCLVVLLPFQASRVLRYCNRVFEGPYMSGRT
jgi:hypothetical protein